GEITQSSGLRWRYRYGPSRSREKGCIRESALDQRACARGDMMKHYCVLIVDDDEKDILDVARAVFKEDPDVKLYTAKDSACAEEKLKKHFFHLALVDPRLDPDDDDRFEGNGVLEQLK